MRPKSTYLRVLFFVSLAAGPVVVACEATLDFDRNKIQHYSSFDGSAAAAAEEDSGGDPGTGTDTPDTGSDMPDTGTKDSGSDADSGK